MKKSVMTRALQALVLCAATGYQGVVLTQDPPQDRLLIEVNMTEGTNMSAAVSPDGSTLILGLQGGLWAVPASGGEAQLLTPPEMDAYEPVWSPDGRLIAFYAFAEDSFTVWLMNADGSGLIELTDGSSDARYPDFSPDGAAVLYSSDEEFGYSIWRHELATGNRSRLTTDVDTGYQQPQGPYFSGNGNAVYPALSPDGSTLAFVIDGEQDRLVVKTIGSNDAPRTVYSEGILSAPTWAPDGSALYVVSVGATSGHLARVPLDGSSAQRLVDGGDVFPFRPSLKPDGGLIYTADGSVRALDAQGRDDGTIRFNAEVTLDRTSYTRRQYQFADTTPRKALGIIDPVLSPDGSAVVFAALGDLWHADIAAGAQAPVRLTDDVFMDLSPSWSPDGSRIAYVSDRDGKADVWVMELATGSTQRVTSAETPANMPVWSPDGNRIAYFTDVGNSIFISGALQVLDLVSGESAEVSEAIFGPSAPAWSPDGSVLAVYHRMPMNSRFREGHNAIYLIPADGQGEPVWVTPVADKSLGRRQFNRPAWSVSGDMVYRIDGELWSVPLASDGTLGEATLIADSGENPSWSADGSSLIYLDGAQIRHYSKGSGNTATLAIQPSWSQALAPESLTIRAGQLFDATSDSYQRNVDIEVVNGVIAAVRPAGSAPVAGRLIDATPP